MNACPTCGSTNLVATGPNLVSCQQCGASVGSPAQGVTAREQPGPYGQAPHGQPQQYGQAPQYGQVQHPPHGPGQAPYGSGQHGNPYPAAPPPNASPHANPYPQNPYAQVHAPAPPQAAASPYGSQPSYGAQGAYGSPGAYGSQQSPHQPYGAPPQGAPQAQVPQLPYGQPGAPGSSPNVFGPNYAASPGPFGTPPYPGPAFGPGMPSARELPSEGTSTGVKVFIGLGVFFLLALIGGGIGVVSWVRSSATTVATTSTTRSTPHGTPTALPTSTGAPTATSRPLGKPTLVVKGSKQSRLTTGAGIWISEVTNANATAVRNVKVTVSLFDASNKRVGEANGYSYRHRLGPNETFPIMIFVADMPTYDRAEVVAQGDFTTTHDPPEISVEVKEHSVTGSKFSKKLIGTVRNATAQNLQFVRVIAVGKNAADEVVAVHQGYASLKEVPPSAESGFSIYDSTIKIENPAKWELSAYGSVKK